jgi:hypothetical protein
MIKEVWTCEKCGAEQHVRDVDLKYCNCGGKFIPKYYLPYQGNKLTAKELAMILGCKSVRFGSYVVFLEW